MTDEMKLVALKARLAKLNSRASKNINSPGVVNKVKRQIAYLEKKVNK